MSDLFSECHRAVQDEYGTRRLADVQERGIVHDVFTKAEKTFVAARDMFFLSSVDPDGRPTVSYKGGAPGFVGFEGNDLVFPSYDGNGMYYSMGNIDASPKVGLLFIDFETPGRLRVQGLASRSRRGVERFPGAEMVVRIKPTAIFVNCPRYVHRYRKIEESRYTPHGGIVAPLAAWKRIDYVRESLSEFDRRRVDAEGTITESEYEKMVSDREA